MAYRNFDNGDDPFCKACRFVLEKVIEGGAENEAGLNRLKKEACRRFRLNTLPSNGDIILRGNDAEKKIIRDLLQRKPVRTISGVAVIAAMTSPAPCPHGQCLPCPGGPSSSFKSPQSYMGKEPAAMRAFEFGFDPYAQVSSRLTQLETIGHDVSKAELIVMGGTFSARSLDYQEWFVKRCLEAMNDHADQKNTEGPSWRDKATSIETPVGRYYPLEAVQKANETAAVRNIGITFETRPDWAKDGHINEFLKLGGTKVELGVQSVYDDVLTKMKRGHTVRETADANRRLRDKGFKVGFHMMPGLFNTDPGRDLEGIRILFENLDFKPDYIKLYPTLVTEGTELCTMWQRGDYTPLNDENAPELVSRIKEILPPWTRLQRIQRDIPADQILCGVKKSNIRQLAEQKLHDRGGRCRCIRCREVGHHWLKGHAPDPENIRLRVEKYEACGGTEHFIEFADVEKDILIGFCRLRFPSNPESPACPLLRKTALIRELHVYGAMLSLGEKSEKSWQHKGYGKELIEKAEETAENAGFEKISVISGIGVREYYRKYGYVFDGVYMSKDLNVG